MITRTLFVVLLFLAFALSSSHANAQDSRNRGILLSNLTWIAAEKVLTRETIIVIPLGAASKEHGPHLRLDNDLSLASYYTERVLMKANVVVAPTITYHFYPAFLEYPGSTHLRFETARDLVYDIVKSLGKAPASRAIRMATARIRQLAFGATRRSRPAKRAAS